MAITTNQNYLAAVLKKFNLNEDDIEVILIESGLDGSADVDTAACKQAMYESIGAILPVASVSEDGFSVTWNVEALKTWYAQLCKELGKPNLIKPAIRNRSNLW